MGGRAPKLVAGVGNVLRRDDGAGVVAARALLEMSLPGDVEVCDVGTVGLEAAPLLEQRNLVVVVDAIDAGRAPGTVMRLRPRELVPAMRSGVSLHDLHLLDALEQTRLMGCAPRRVVVLAVQVADVTPGIGLSPAVERAMGRIVKYVIHELGVRRRVCGAWRPALSAAHAATASWRA